MNNILEAYYKLNDKREKIYIQMNKIIKKLVCFF